MKSEEARLVARLARIDAEMASIDAELATLKTDGEPPQPSELPGPKLPEPEPNEYDLDPPVGWPSTE
jgi:hypothetical protein